MPVAPITDAQIDAAAEARITQFRATQADHRLNLVALGVEMELAAGNPTLIAALDDMIAAEAANIAKLEQAITGYKRIANAKKPNGDPNSVGKLRKTADDLIAASKARIDARPKFVPGNLDPGFSPR